MKPDLNNLKNRIEEKRDFIDRIALEIPFFKGYLVKSENYDADLMVRSFIADKLLTVKKHLGAVSSEALKKEDYNLIKEIESLSVTVEGLVKKVRYSEYGTTGAFSKAKITEDDQSRLLEYDWRLLSSADELVESISKISSSDCVSIPEGLNSAGGMIADFESAFNERKNVILEVI
jgi:hypothetical protein